MPPIETPIIKSYLSKNDLARDLVRYELCLDTLEGAICKGHIYNVVFNDTKFSIGRHVERVLGKAWEESREAFSRPPYQYHNDISMFCGFNQAAGRIKRLSKLPRIPALDRYIGLLKEIVVIWNTFVELKPLVIKGRRPPENPTDVDLTNTGHCGVCGRLQKLKDHKLVHHGFKISDGRGWYFGYRAGSCFAVGYEPYELSCAANIAYLVKLGEWLKSAEEAYVYLNSGTVEERSTRKARRNLTVFSRGTSLRPHEKSALYILRLTCTPRRWILGSCSRFLTESRLLWLCRFY
jgi:hypothetical protein